MYAQVTSSKRSKLSAQETIASSTTDTASVSEEQNTEGTGPSELKDQDSSTTSIGRNEWGQFSPTAPLNELLRAEINGRLATEETIKELLQANRARAQTAENQLARIELKCFVLPHVRDAILRRVFYNGGPIMRQCDGVWGFGCGFNSSISIFAGTIIIRIDDVRSVVCQKCFDANQTQINQFMVYNVSFEKCKTFLLRSGLSSMGKCDVCDVTGVTAASTWERAHDIARSDDGSNESGNLFIAHEGCNFLQHVMPIDVFRTKLGLCAVNRGIRIAYGAAKSDVSKIIREIKDSEKTATEVLQRARRLFI